MVNGCKACRISARTPPIGKTGSACTRQVMLSGPKSGSACAAAPWSPPIARTSAPELVSINSPYARDHRAPGGGGTGLPLAGLTAPAGPGRQSFA
jgi:hypothetical protein